MVNRTTLRTTNKKPSDEDEDNDNNDNNNNDNNDNDNNDNDNNSFHSSASQIQQSPSSSSAYSSNSTTTTSLSSFNPPPTPITNSHTNHQTGSPAAVSKRIRAVQELVETESIYASDLLIISDVYLFRSSGPPPSPPPLSTTDRQAIFSNINQLTHLAQSLAQALLKASTTDSIGYCFIQFLPKIERLFTVYCSKYSTANKRLEEFTQRIARKQLKLEKSHHHHPHHKPNQEHIGIKYLNECKSLCQGRTSAWDLGSLLIKPVQRCLKYSLLLDQIIRNTEAHHPDLTSLLRARDGMVTVADSINETKRRHEVVGEIITRQPPLTTRYAVRLGPRHSNPWSSPPELTPLFVQLRDSSKALGRLPADLISSQNSIINWIVAADRLVNAFKHVFALKTHHHPPSSINFHLTDLESYQHLVLRGTLNGPLKYLRERIKKEIIPQIEQLKLLYTKPMMLIEKYERRTQLVVVSHRLPSTSTTTSTNTGHSSSSPASPSTQPTPPAPFSSTLGSDAAELREIERFLLDQLPKLIRLGNLTLHRILLNLFYSIKLYHSDLIILIKKALKI